ncbi:MAG: hypothetical protein WEB30_11175 [Cyclobacteriaceae bacterium]
MAHAALTKPNKATLKIEKWFSDTYGKTERSPEEIQLLILYKIHELEERLKTVERQTKTHWVN